MDDRYSSTGEDSRENGYGEGQGSGFTQQPTVQEQLQYQYQQPQDEREEPVSMGEWVISLLIMMIPCANIIMAFVWAFSSKEKKSKSNYFKAYLIFLAIQIVLAVVLMIIYVIFLGSILNTMVNY